MSNIYIQEPATNGKVLLKTTVGDIDIELWSKETPKAARNFVQLCMEGYYDATIFHRVVKNFIVQGGDPEGTGHGGESVYGYPFKDEFHSRLRFVRRGLVAMANAGPNDNGSQFFFTMDSTPELSNKHTIFGKVGGNTLYNMLKLQEVDVGPNDRPYYPVKIISTEVLSNPFDDIVPRQLKRGVKKDKVEEKKNKSQSKATKNFSLLSFGEEAEEDEVEVDKASKDMRGKSKSSHDLTDDPKLSAIPAIESEGEEKTTNDEEEQADESDSKSGKMEDSPQTKKRKCEEEDEDVPSKWLKDSSFSNQDENVSEQKLSRSEELRLEAEKLKKEIRNSRQGTTAEKEEREQTEHGTKTEVVAEFRKEREKYKEMKRQQGKKGSGREALTLELLSKFQNRLRAAQMVSGTYSDDDDDEEEEEEAEEDLKEGETAEVDEISDLSWLRHKLHFVEPDKKVLDANVHDIDRYELFDPRNPLNKRRREVSKQALREK